LSPLRAALPDTLVRPADSLASRGNASQVHCSSSYQSSTGRLLLQAWHTCWVESKKVGAMGNNGMENQNCNSIQS
jgi:hypothetical protein